MARPKVLLYEPIHQKGGMKKDATNPPAIIPRPNSSLPISFVLLERHHVKVSDQQTPLIR